MDKVTRFQRAASVFHWFVTWIPYYCLAAFLLLALSIRATLHRWPVVYRDNPDGIIISVLGAIAVWLFVLLLASPAVWIVSGAFLLGLDCRSVLKRSAVIYAVGVLLFLIVSIFDPTGFFEWFWD